MAKSNFLTDRFSTTGGLAAVAYGSSSLFATVADQIKQNSKTKALDKQIPSHAFLDFVGTDSFVFDIVKSVFQKEYDLESDLTDFIDLYAKDVDNFSISFTNTFIRNINKYSTYSLSVSIAFSDTLEETVVKFSDSTDLEINYADLTNKISTEFIEAGYIGEDIQIFLAFLINNPNTKIASAPPDTLVQLDVQGISTKDHRGVERNFGTLPPQDYYAGVAYNADGTLLKKAILQGYVGYPLVTLLGESLLNSDAYENLNVGSIGSSVLGEVSANSNLSAGEEAIYNINLATIDIGTN